ncbi:MAG: hypothetical protein QM736_14480 [Vicinamibacterales bacterium]
MGSKTAARKVAMHAGVPVVPGTRTRSVRMSPTRRCCDRRADRLPAARQGGCGWRRQRHAHRADADDLLASVRAARSEAGTAFGDPAVYLERRIMRPRHIEVQLLADQPRHRRAVRRARVLDPAPPPEGRRGNTVARRDAGDCGAMTAAAAAVARAVGYTNAGTIEFLLDETAASISSR